MQRRILIIVVVGLLACRRADGAMGLPASRGFVGLAASWTRGEAVERSFTAQDVGASAASLLRG